MKQTKKIFLLFISLLIPFVAAAIGSTFNAKSLSTWYPALEKPVLNPPNWIFGPVWTALYLLMGVSLYLILTRSVKNKIFSFGIIIFAAQLALNAVWSILFFGLQNPFYSLIEILILLTFIFSNILVFHKIYPLAGYLLVPYALWVSFATYLNYSIWILN